MKNPSTPTRRHCLHIALGAALAGSQALARAETATRIVVPFGAGGPPDTIARFLVPVLGASGKNYIVDNKPGAGGIIGTAEVAKAVPNGATLLITTGGHSTNAVLNKNLPYDSLKGLTPISKLVVNTGFLLLVPDKSPYRTLEDLLAAARAKPGQLSYGSSGNGNTTHIAGALFERHAGLRLIHVPYRNGPVADLMGGQIDMLFWGSGSAIPLVRGGKVRALAIAGETRLAELPDVPTLAERNVKGVDVPAWIALFGPAGLPAQEANRIAQDVTSAMKQPEFITAMKGLPDTRVVGSKPEEFRRDLTAEVARLTRELAPLGIEMQ